MTELTGQLITVISSFFGWKTSRRDRKNVEREAKDAALVPITKSSWHQTCAQDLLHWLLHYKSKISTNGNCFNGIATKYNKHLRYDWFCILAMWKIFSWQELKQSKVGTYRKVREITHIWSTVKNMQKTCRVYTHNALLRETVKWKLSPQPTYRQGKHLPQYQTNTNFFVVET